MNSGEDRNSMGSQKGRSLRVGLHPMTPFMVGIAGGTGSGKTTCARRLAKMLASANTVTLLDMDSYYNDMGFIPLEEREHVNYDHPDAVDFVRLHEDLVQLKQWRTIIKPVFDSATHTRHAGGSVLMAGQVVIAEGSMLFVDEALRNLFQIKIFVETPADVRLRRRLERDVRERGRALTTAIDHYMASVLPMHDRFIEPAKQHAEFVIPGWEDAERFLDQVVSTIRQHIRVEAEHYSPALGADRAMDPQAYSGYDKAKKQENTIV
jgi:uridine kinase